MIRVDYIFYVEKYHGRLIDDEESLKLPVLKANTYLNQVLRRKPLFTFLIRNPDLIHIFACQPAIDDVGFLICVKPDRIDIMGNIHHLL